MKYFSRERERQRCNRLIGLLHRSSVEWNANRFRLLKRKITHFTRWNYKLLPCERDIFQVCEINAIRFLSISHLSPFLSLCLSGHVCGRVMNPLNSINHAIDGEYICLFACVVCRLCCLHRFIIATASDWQRMPYVYV